jgi:hypothetical protein
MVRSQRILLSQASGIMTKRLDECVNVAKRISLDKNILRLSSDLKEYEIFEGIKNMAKHVETNSFFSNIIIKKNNDNTLYTSEGTVFENVLLTRKYRFTQEEYEIFNKCISDGVECLYYFNNAQITMQFIPIPVLSRNPNGCLIFVIEKQSLMGIFSDEQQFNYNTTFLVNEYQQPIFILDNSNVISSEEMFTAVLSAHGNDSFRFDKKNYTLIEEDIKGAGWRLVSIIPDEWLQQRMKSAYLVIWIVAILLISALLVFLFSRRQYNPIKALSQIVGNNTSVNNTSYDNRKTMNELQNISYALSASKALGEQAKIQSRLLRQNLILRLLDCDIKDIKELNEIFKALGMFKEKAMYSVISIRIKDKLVNFDYDNLLHYIDQKYSTYDMAYSVKVAAQEVIAVIVKLNDNVQYALEYIIDDIKNYLSENIGFQTDFGIGRPYPLERSSISYLESIAALEHLSQNGIEHVAYFNDIQFAPIMDIEFRKKIRQYLHCLQQPDRKTAYTLLDEIMAILYKQTSKQIQMYFRYKLIEPVFHMLADENISNRLRKEHETNITSLYN